MTTLASRFFWLLGASAVALGIGTLVFCLPTITRPISLLGGQDEDPAR